jgi:Cu/Ag efflux protein CusF
MIERILSAMFLICIMKMTKAYAWTAVCASVFTLATAVPSLADQTATAAKPDKTYTGTVSTVDPAGRTMEVKGVMLSKTFNLGENCTYVLWEKPQGAIADLRPGERVTVGYQDDNGVLVADSVNQDSMTDQGMVKAIDPATHSMTLRSGWMDHTLIIPDDCQFVLRGGKSGLLADIQPGNEVTVTYEKPNGKATAREIAQTSATYTGELTAIDLDQKTMKAKAPFSSKQFVVGNDCAIIINGNTDGKLTDLRPGESLSFSYDNVNGVNIVNRIAPTGTPPATQPTAMQQPLPMQ